MAAMIKGIERVVKNAQMLSVPEIADCFLYGCEDYDGLNSIIEEIDELNDSLPEEIDLLDLPETYCGNTKSKIFGVATCESTHGHGIFKKDASNRVILESPEAAYNLGYRPCRRCMHDAYLDWKEMTDSGHVVTNGKEE